jgi:hypothetical protein
MLEMQQFSDTFRGNYQNEAGRMNSPLHGCLKSEGANSFALAAAQNDNRGNIETKDRRKGDRSFLVPYP